MTKIVLWLACLASLSHNSTLLENSIHRTREKKAKASSTKSQTYSNSRFVHKNPNTSLAAKVFGIDSIFTYCIIWYFFIRKMITFDCVVLFPASISDVNCWSKNKNERNKFNTKFRCQVITKKLTETKTKLAENSTPPKGSALTMNNGAFIPRRDYGCNQ